MNVSVEAPDLRGTVVIFNVTIRLTREGLKIAGTMEIQPVYPAP